MKTRHEERYELYRFQALILSGGLVVEALGKHAYDLVVAIFAGFLFLVLVGFAISDRIYRLRSQREFERVLPLK